ncbi:MAG: hypothetical protein JWN75_1254 [Candidatus Saccharibacteria bacterium]|nr:hypothetical protein [Candidatus Saccharibacteria bacterium]
MPTIASYVTKAEIKLGDEGPAVVALQKILASRNYALMGTGFFGPKTKTAVATFQKIRGLKSTGVVDMTTAISLDQVVPKAAPPKENTPPWLSVAIQSIGIAEGPGGLDNPVVLAMAKKCGGAIAKNYVHDSIAWCKMFTEFCLASVGLKGVDSLWALDNAKLGTTLKGAAVGAIACKKRTGGGHTFIVAGKDKNGNIVGIGGNQGDRVSRATFPPSVIVSYNWPNGYPLPAKTGISSLPVVDSAPLSKQEA